MQGPVKAWEGMQGFVRICKDLCEDMRGCVRPCKRNECVQGI